MSRNSKNTSKSYKVTSLLLNDLTLIDHCKRAVWRHNAFHSAPLNENLKQPVYYTAFYYA